MTARQPQPSQPSQVGFIMLCHTALERAAQTASALASQGCPLVIHVDARCNAAPLYAAQQAWPQHIKLSSTHYACDWGSWGLVQATQDAGVELLQNFPHITHVYLISGACLPLRPMGELNSFLSAHPDVDFIDSTPAAKGSWPVDGLGDERFSLFFPVSWQKNRRIFDALVDIQRRLHIRRKLPPGLEAHLGSQWWCLTRRTLHAILHHPNRARYDRFFRRSWIPDEGYFQTLARGVSANVAGHSLTFHHFDAQGKPFTLYDDHLPLLAQQGPPFFFARKIWPQADALYKWALERPPERAPRVKSEQGNALSLYLTQARTRRQQGRTGLAMQSRFTQNGRETARPYDVFIGFDTIFTNFQQWLAQNTAYEVHGRLFHPQKAVFSTQTHFEAGALSAQHKLRDYDPIAFLRNLLWNTQERPYPCFLFSQLDNPKIAGFIAQDPNARLCVIPDVWQIDLQTRDIPAKKRRKIHYQMHRQMHRQQAAFTRLEKTPQKTLLNIPLEDIVRAPERAMDPLYHFLKRSQQDINPISPPSSDVLRLLKGLVK